MNNRIYPKEVFEKAVRDLESKTKIYHCPYCFSSDLNDVTESGIIYLSDVICFSCKEVFSYDLRITKQQVRDKKIDRLLEK